VAEAECRRAADAAGAAYTREFDKEGVTADPEALLLEHLVSITHHMGTLLFWE
jgi:hypothetical protein